MTPQTSEQQNVKFIMIGDTKVKTKDNVTKSFMLKIAYQKYHYKTKVGNKLVKEVINLLSN